ncbi:MAG: metal-dependent hydrolase [Pseudomonadota bacterium]
MDPVSQAALGAACAQTLRRPGARAVSLGWLAMFGLVAGMAPDLDVLLTSDEDPLLFLVYHRQFTHSLVFIPVGALLVTAALYWLPTQPLRFRDAYLASFVGFGSHGLLDACTTYGTQLLWPFSDARITWNTIAVVDPLFTLPLLAMVAAAVWYRRRGLVVLGLCWAVAYLGLGYVQRLRVEDATRTLIAERQHDGERLFVKPAFGNLLLWKSIYRSDDVYVVDGHRAGVRVTHCGGERIATLNVAQDLPWLDVQDQQAQDLERFRWFSMDYLAMEETEPAQRVIDIRYSMLPTAIDPLWGITLQRDRGPEAHVEWWSERRLTDAQRDAFLALLHGSSC